MRPCKLSAANRRAYRASTRRRQIRQLQVTLLSSAPPRLLTPGFAASGRLLSILSRRSNLYGFGARFQRTTVIQPQERPGASR